MTFEKDGKPVEKYHVQVRDEMRKPFIARWFNDPVSADDFVESVKSGFSTRGAKNGNAKQESRRVQRFG